ncbi:MAG: sigma-70 family RNA polymerase sigma factor [Muribaculaceae bacterium]|nr:sigma-70 family RNA polymerase sigma factor [Muribaculaceae bacterium]
MITSDNIERLFRENYNQMLRLAFAILQDENAARDVVHDVFASIIDNGSAVNTSRYANSADCSRCGNTTESATLQYLLRATRNRCLNQLRHLSVRERIHGLYLLDMEEDINPDWPDENTFLAIRRTVESELSGNCKDAVKLRFQKGLDTKKIASILGISRQAVYKHLSHAVNILRTKLRNHE